MCVLHVMHYIFFYRIISDPSLMVATFADPRFQSEMKVNDIELVRQYLNGLPSTNIQQPQEEEEEELTVRTGLSSLFTKRKSISTIDMRKKNLFMEIENYIKLARIEIHQCPFKWWSEAGYAETFANIHRLKEKFFCVPALSNNWHRLPLGIMKDLGEKYNKIDPIDFSLLWLHLQSK